MQTKFNSLSFWWTKKKICATCSKTNFIVLGIDRSNWFSFFLCYFTTAYAKLNNQLMNIRQWPNAISRIVFRCLKKVGLYVVKKNRKLFFVSCMKHLLQCRRKWLLSKRLKKCGCFSWVFTVIHGFIYPLEEVEWTDFETMQRWYKMSWY